MGNKRPPIKTTTKQAIAYWRSCSEDGKANVDWSEAETHCWRCCCQRNLQRCHIVPDALGGPDAPDNIILLCSRCHAEAPNVTDPEVMWDWIQAYNHPFYGTFWILMGMKEYRFIYQKSITQKIEGILSAAGKTPDPEMVGDIISQQHNAVRSEAIRHFGQPYFNTATVAGLYRMMLKRLAASYNVSFPIGTDPRTESKQPWWYIID